MASQNFLNSEFLVFIFGTFGMEIKVFKNGEMVRDVIVCNSSGGGVINYICVYMIK